ncbi:MAG: hypothetical protein AAFX40_03660 [Cyanobacteria bacterium J06639_1]
MSTTDILQAFQAALADKNLSVQLQAQDNNLHVLVAGEVGKDCDLETASRTIARDYLASAESTWATLTVWTRSPGQEKSAAAVHLNLAELWLDAAPTSTADEASSPETIAEHSDSEASAKTSNHSQGATASSESTAETANEIAARAAVIADHPVEPHEAADSPIAANDGDRPEDANAGAFDLSQYCFTRNTMLLTHKLPAPSASVAKAVWFIHELDDRDRQRMFPALSEFFQSSEIGERESLTPEMQEWFDTATGFDERKLKSLSVWLSRYCRNAEGTAAELQSAIAVAPASPTSEPETSDPVEENHPSPTRSPRSSSRSRPHARRQANQADRNLARQVLPARSTDRTSGLRYLLSRWGEWNPFTLVSFAVVVALLMGGTVFTGCVQRSRSSTIHMQVD